MSASRFAGSKKADTFNWSHKGASGAWVNSIYKIVFKDTGGASEAAQEGCPEANKQTIERPAKQKREEDRAIADSMLAIWREECGKLCRSHEVSIKTE
jgi:hypothetical protein